MERTIGLTLDSILVGANKELTTQGAETRFKLPLSSPEVVQGLSAVYKKGVANRGRAYISDKDTTDKIDKVANWLTSSTLKPMLLLYGDMGTGKTEMAKSIANLIYLLGNNARKLLKENGSWLTTEQDDREQARLFDAFIHLPIPMLKTAQELAEDAREESQNYEKAKKSKLLVIDDLGVEPAIVKNYGSDKYPLVDVISYRYDKLYPTIITTNLTIERIGEYYGARVADRLNEVCERLFYKGCSFRIRN